MKKTPGFGVPSSKNAPENFTAQDKKKLIIMGLILVFVTVGYFASLFTEGKYKNQEHAAADLQRPEPEQIYVPEFDFAALNDSIDDSNNGEVRIEKEPLARILDHTGQLTALQYEQLGTVNLNAEVCESLMADPANMRGKAVRARGTIEEMILRSPEKGDRFFEGRLRLEDDTPCYFAVSRLPEDEQGPASPGTFVRINGRFMKAHRTETDRGWERGPLLVARDAVFSYESVGDRVTSLPKSVFSLVEDDSATEGERGDPFTAYWTLLAYARDLEEGDIDWDSVPEMDNLLLAEMLKDGKPFRAKPFRIPVSVNMETRQITMRENPARLEAVSRGWIGNQNWSAGNGLIKFEGPFPNPLLERKDLVTARGFFFRNHLYEPARGGVALAPLFILTDIEKFAPEEDQVVPMIFTGVVILTVALIGLLWVLLMRDKRKSNVLQEELVRRRRERRARNGSTGTPSPRQT